MAASTVIPEETELSARDHARIAKEVRDMIGDDYTHGGDVNFSILTDSDEYYKYFTQFERVGRILMAFYRRRQDGESENFEAQCVRSFLERFCYTAKCLRMKYAYDPNHHLRVDLAESGFPNRLEIDNMQTDLSRREDRLKNAESAASLKRRLVDFLIKYHRESPELLEALANRTYHEMLDESCLFLTFTPGQLIRRESRTPGLRSWAYSWACYDFSTNLPYVHILTFDQDANCVSFENDSDGYRDFVNVIKNEGNRAPQLGTLAVRIDDALPAIHPKVLKRICLGPLYSRLLFDNYENSNDPWQKIFERLMAESAGSPDDFVLFMTDEVVVSKGQKTVGNILSRRVREVFDIPELDLQCYSRQASVVHRYAFMPHHLLQHAEGDGELMQAGFDRENAITFDSEDQINA